MKPIHLLAGIGSALVLAACGGNNGSGSSSTSSTSTTGTGTGTVTPVTAPASAHIEAVVTNPTTFDTATVGGQTISFQYQDPLSIQSLDAVTFQLVAYVNGVRTVYPANQWSSSDSTNLYGTLGSNNGQFVAARNTTQSPLSISVTYNGQSYGASYQVLPREVRERGLVQGDVSKAGLSGVEVDFYGFADSTDNTPFAVTTVNDSAGNPVTEYVLPTTLNTSTLQYLGRTFSQFNGTIRGSFPQGTYGFTINSGTIPSGYARYFRYKGVLYNTGDITPLGLAPLPTPAPIVKPPSSYPSPFPSSPTAAQTATLPDLNNYFLNGEFSLIDSTNSNAETDGIINLIPSTESVTPPAN